MRGRTTNPLRILVAEDDKRMAALLHQGFSEEGHHSHIAETGAEALDAARANTFDVIVLDVMLPVMDGLTVARKLRSAGNQTPILMLTARDSLNDIVKGLDAGADDYLIKPFAFEVLLARLRAVSRRGPIARSVCLVLADLKLDTITRKVTRHGQTVNLTPREYGLLELLFRNTGRPMTRDAIIESVWGFDAEVEENTVEAFVRLLRHKIDVPFEPKLIHTVRGIGYCLRLPES